MSRPLHLFDTTDVVAKYKIEVMFGSRRTRQESIGAIQLYESSAALNGEGDIKIYWCGHDDCGRFMPFSSRSAGEPFCEHCHRVQRPGDLVGERLFRCSTQKLATMLEKVFHDVGGNADIYIKYHPDDIRRATLDNVGFKQVAALEKARSGTQRPYIYPLRNIIRDCPDGSSMVRKLEAFLNA